MGAKIVQIRPTLHEDYVIAPDDFPSNPDAAYCLGVRMAMSMPVVLRPLAYCSTSVTLTGLPEALVEAFNDGLNWRSAAPLAGFLPTNCIGQPRSSWTNRQKHYTAL
jgi:hypothetical protein